MHTLPSKMIQSVSVLTFICMAGIAQAAVISGSFTDNTSVSGVDLDTLGALDWRIWDDPTNDDINAFSEPTAPLHNQRSGGTSISDLTVQFGAGGTGSGFAPGHTYTYATGTSPALETATQYGVSIAGNQADLVGAFFDFDITTANSQEHTLIIYGAHTRIGSVMTLTLNGATTEVDTLETSGTGTRSWVYTATFTPDFTGDVLNVRYTPSSISTGSTNNGNRIRFGAVAVTAVPEPSSLALLGISALAGLMFFKRRK